MIYRYEVKRRRKTNEEIEHLKELWGNDLDFLGLPMFDENNPEHIFGPPEVLMLCRVCHKEAWIEQEFLIEMNYGYNRVTGLNCVYCSSDEMRMYPKNLVDKDNNPISIEFLLKNYRKKK